MYQQHNPLNELGQLVSSLGKQSFSEQLLHSMKTMSGCDHCTFVTYDAADKQPHTLVCTGSIEKKLSLECSRLYDAHYYQLDPNFSILTQLQQEGEVAVCRKKRNDIHSADYCKTLFDRCSVHEKVTVLYRVSGHVLGLNLYRLKNSRYAQPLTLEWIQSSTQLLSSLLQKHVQLLDDFQGQHLDSHWLQQSIHLKFNDMLTKREQQICLTILLGQTSDEIATNLNISVNTVLTHRRNTYEKLGIKTKNQLFALLVDGLLQRPTCN